MELYAKRVENVQKIMQREGYDYLILAPSANMLYFSGMKTSPDERLQILLIPASGQPSGVFPEMYREKLDKVLSNRFSILTWDDTKDSSQVLKKLLGEEKPTRIAIDDTLWSSHLIAMMPVFDGCSFYPVSRVAGTLRQFKDANEIETLKKAGEIADQVMEKVRNIIRPGMSEKELSIFIETHYKELADDISFKPIIASGPNGASPHHSTGERAFQLGDFIVVDCGGLVSGYCSDITRTFCLGKADNEMKQVYQAVQDANQAAFEAITRGCTCEEADVAARSVITNAGYGPNFIHRTGHGIGLDVHEAPYLVAGNSEEIVPGMVFSIEPGVYLPGKFGVRIEDIVAMTDQGPIRLNNFARNLIEIS
jgi:Xaa-Pro dipeptidase